MSLFSSYSPAPNTANFSFPEWEGALSPSIPFPPAPCPFCVSSVLEVGGTLAELSYLEEPLPVLLSSEHTCIPLLKWTALCVIAALFLNWSRLISCGTQCWKKHQSLRQS